MKAQTKMTQTKTIELEMTEEEILEILIKKVCEDMKISSPDIKYDIQWMASSSRATELFGIEIKISETTTL